MAFLRTKTVKGERYAYLVRSVWDSKKSTSRQEIIKYLGRASEIKAGDIPAQYRQDRKIAAFFKVRDRFKDSKKADAKFRRDLLELLKAADSQGAARLYAEYKKMFGMAEFYENVFLPVMYKIGSMWAEKKISIGTEHVCSNTAESLVSVIKHDASRRGRGQKILICSPAGEEHSISCGVLESYLSSKGYGVLNMSPSAPAESVLAAIRDERPDMIMVSVTLEDNVPNGQRLVKKITKECRIPVVVGGQAVSEGSGFEAGVYCGSLGGIARLVSKTLQAELRS